MLTDTTIKNAKPKEKPYRLADEKGLYLEVKPNGGKYFRMKYRFEGKEKLLAFGVYPETGLKDARERRDQARKLLAQGIDPGAQRKAMKAAKSDESNTFEVVAREWIGKFAPFWSDSHRLHIEQCITRDVFPFIGSRPIKDITAPELLAVLRRIESRNALETAHRTKQFCGQAFRYAVATGRAERDPSADLKGALPPVKGRHYASLTEPKAIGELLRAIDGYGGAFAVKCALRLAPLVFVRPGELRQAEWAEFDLDKAEWRIPGEKMKAGGLHVVPLSTQALMILRELHPLTGGGRYVFPSARTPHGNRCMSENAILAALRRMGYGKDEMTGHGFRAMARTVLDEVLHVRPDYIEHQLAHAVRDPNGRAYNRTAHLPERRKMMQDWADYLDGLRNGEK